MLYRVGDSARAPVVPDLLPDFPPLSAVLTLMELSEASRFLSDSFFDLCSRTVPVVERAAGLGFSGDETAGV